MARLLILAAGILALIAGFRWLQQHRQTLKKTEIIKAALMVVLVFCLLLVVTGRAHWLVVIGAGLLALLQRFLPLIIRLLPAVNQVYRSRQQRASAQTNQSKVQSDVLLMTLDHGSGQLDGEVLQGPFTGKRLSELNQDQLTQLYQFCQQQDAESVQLLEAYLQKRFGGSWQAQADEAQQANQRQTTTDMSRQEALDILGLQEGASKAEIVKAHRQLMQKLHPDHGGNDYLAAKVNAAKRLLLGR